MVGFPTGNQNRQADKEDADTGEDDQIVHSSAPIFCPGRSIAALKVGCARKTVLLSGFSDKGESVFARLGGHKNKDCQMSGGL
jgi:hypothetical protein